MEKMIFKLVAIAFCFSTFCNNVNGDDFKQDSSTLKSILENQLRSGDYEIVRKYSEADFLVTLPIIRDSLNAHGIYPVENYSEKIEALFGEYPDKEIYSVVDKLTGASGGKTFSYTAMGETFYYYFSNKYGFITDFYLLPMILDYEGKFPAIAQIEEELKIQRKVSDMETGKLRVVNVMRWKDMDNLNKLRQNTMMDLCAINKYCFLNDRSSFDYLVKNNWGFLDCLLKHGYGKDSILNTKFLARISDLSKDRNRQQNVEYIFNKMSGSLKVNIGLLNSIKNSQSHMELLYDFAINLYLKFEDPIGVYLPLDDNQPDKYYKFYTLAEKRKIIAYITSVYNPLFNSLPQNSKLKLRYPNTPIDVIRYWDKGLMQEIKDNNYYGIDNLNVIIDSIQTLNKVTLGCKNTVWDALATKDKYTTDFGM